MRRHSCGLRHPLPKSRTEYRPKRFQQYDYGQNANSFVRGWPNCILNSVSETTKSNMAAGSAMMDLLLTAIWILAGGMEDVLSIPRRDPYFALVMSFAVGGAQGMLRSGRPAEVDAGSWSVDAELTGRSVNAVVMPGLINEPGDSEAKLRFIRKELNLQHMKDARNMTRKGNNQQAYLAIGWLLRLVERRGNRSCAIALICSTGQMLCGFGLPKVADSKRHCRPCSCVGRIFGNILPGVPRVLGHL